MLRTDSAILMRPDGGIETRLTVIQPAPVELSYGGDRWRLAYRTDSGVVYRLVPGSSCGPRWSAREQRGRLSRLMTIGARARPLRALLPPDPDPAPDGC